MLERFHWTFEQLDAADMARLFPGVSAANMADSLRSVQRWMDLAGRGLKTAMPSENELSVWGEVNKAMTEVGSD